jgi:hypothetical protein
VSDVMEVGRILVREGTLLPGALQLQSEPYMPGWRLVTELDTDRLSERIHQAGWTFFSLAGEIQASGFDRERQKTVRSGVKRILANPKSSKFNALELTGVASKRFLGMPYVTVSARSRHIQEGMQLLGPGTIESRAEQRLLPPESTLRTDRGQIADVGTGNSRQLCVEEISK